MTIKAQTVDRYGRTVAEVIGAVNINLALVEDGMVFAYRKDLSQCAARKSLEAEYRAMRRRYGVSQCLVASPARGTSVAAELPLDPVVIPDPFLGAGGTLHLRPGR
ncbi:thermonuclease family protein [Synechococcus sp. BA-132 BA5]|uniref:thermonuclease family protein n=1 Tax=Synechococcus sp. BA-132 BA5 TaxID=3110252 RepID=UPI002B1FC10B|nr:thermonuclease family protein [Synechococcus sp. BA-132 BA5]MEA5414323.1 thermonuclease family protein [Synechococcus sp. BA-132 BA5]